MSKTGLILELTACRHVSVSTQLQSFPSLFSWPSHFLSLQTCGKKGEGKASSSSSPPSPFSSRQHLHMKNKFLSLSLPSHHHPLFSPTGEKMCSLVFGGGPPSVVRSVYAGFRDSCVEEKEKEKRTGNENGFSFPSFFDFSFLLAKREIFLVQCGRGFFRHTHVLDWQSETDGAFFAVVTRQ